LQDYDASTKALANLHQEADQPHTPLTLDALVERKLMEINERIAQNDVFDKPELDNLLQEKSKLQVFLFKRQYDEDETNFRNAGQGNQAYYSELQSKQHTSESNLDDAIAISYVHVPQNQGAPVGVQMPLLSTNKGAQTGYEIAELIENQVKKEYDEVKAIEPNKHYEPQMTKLYTDLISTLSAVKSDTSKEASNKFTQALEAWNNFLKDEDFKHYFVNKKRILENRHAREQKT